MTVRSFWTRVALAIPCTLGLAGCSVISIPTSTSPVCSWNSQVPAHASDLCNKTFDTLSRVAKAVQKGDAAAVHRLVTNPAVAARMLAYGAQQRQNGMQGLHVVPSLTLETSGAGRYGAGIFLGAGSRSGHIHLQETLYLRLKHGKLVVVGDQPGQEW